MPIRFTSAIDRVVYHTDFTESCWLWLGIHTQSGYGKLKINKRWVRAHRFVYELFRGDIPKGFVLDHLCRVRSCINPDHLEVVTIKENILRGIGPSATYAKRTHCADGHSLLPDSGTVRMYKGARICIICTSLKAKKRYSERKATNA